MKSIMLRFLLLIIVVGLLFSGACALYVSHIYKSLPDISSLRDYAPPVPSKILARGGEVLLELGRENRAIVDIEQIPPLIVGAFLAAEDDQFYEHQGVNYMGLARAMLANIKAMRVVQGGSTITQQVAKMMFLTREKTIARKLKDFLLALKLEKEYSKQDILHVYLNHVYLGAGYYGIKEAFSGYFSKSLENISPAEAALVAGLLVAPGRYSPYINPGAAKRRQRYVLQRMNKIGLIDDEQLSELLVLPIKLFRGTEEQRVGQYFSEWVRQRVIVEIGVEEFLTGGYIVETSLDYEMQKVAESEIKNGLHDLDKRQGFHGPIKRVEGEEIFLEEFRYRKKLLRENSRSFTLAGDGELSFERDMNVDEAQTFVANRHAQYHQVTAILKEKKNLFVPGADEKDEFLSVLKKDQFYDAIVMWTSNIKKVIYASIGGVNVVIPHDGFKWAHKRHINDKKPYYGQINNPSTLVKRGDVISVKITSDEPKSLWRIIDKDGRKLVQGQKETVAAWKAEKFHTAQLEQVPEAQGAMVSLDPKTGEVLCLVGGYDFETSKFNRVIQSKRQAGSSFKPIIFAAALENGYTPATLLSDTPQSLTGVDQFFDWKPKNYDDKFKGMVTLRQAIEESRNVPTIHLLQSLGVDKVIKFLDRFDIKLNVPEDLSISLGSFGISPLELTTMFSIFPNGGQKIYPKSILRIIDSKGKEYEFDEHAHLKEELESNNEILDLIAQLDSDEIEEDLDLVAEELPGEEEYTEEEKEKLNLVLDAKVEKKYIDFTENLSDEQIYDERLSFLVNSLLKGVIKSGTGRKAAKISPFIGGKTGTTNSYVDAWFVGYSPNIVTSVWVGMDDNSTLGYGETGARAALPIWMEFMRYAVKARGELDFRIPQGVTNVRIDPTTGRIARPQTPGAVREYFVEGMEPGGEFGDALKFGEESEGLRQALDDDDYYMSQ